MDEHGSLFRGHAIITLMRECKSWCKYQVEGQVEILAKGAAFQCSSKLGEVVDIEMLRCWFDFEYFLNELVQGNICRKPMLLSQKRRLPSFPFHQFWDVHFRQTLTLVELCAFGSCWAL